MIAVAPRSSRGPDAADKVVHLIQGEHRVSGDPHVMFTTILGSCVAACIRDPLAGVGGMNHFLLPGAQPTPRIGEAERYAAYLMELLVNALLNAGARRGRLEAKIFGGAAMLGGVSDIGERNGIFASEFLAKEGIQVTGRCLGGFSGRRIQYWPVSGRARRVFVRDTVEPTPVFTAPASGAGSLELF